MNICRQSWPMRSEISSLRSMLKTTWVPAVRPMPHLTESVTTTLFRSTVFACRSAARNHSTKRISGGSRRSSTATSRRSFRSISPGQPTARLISTMSETLFIAELVRRTGCGLLLDINNVFVSATNHGFAALAYLADFPLEHVSEIHLAGHTEQADDEGDLLLIDSHDRPVTDAVWKLFDTVIGQYGPIPTLVEWDSDLPDWPLLKAEADAAQAIIDRHAQGFMPGKAHAAR